MEDINETLTVIQLKSFEGKRLRRAMGFGATLERGISSVESLFEGSETVKSVSNL
jgi:hypothetical protein